MTWPAFGPHRGVGHRHDQASQFKPQGDIPENQAFVVDTASDHSLTVKYPEGWAETQSGSTVTFSDKFNSVRLSPHPGFYSPNETYARSAEVQIASSTTDFVPEKVGTVARPAGQVFADHLPGRLTAQAGHRESVQQAVEATSSPESGCGAVATLLGPIGTDNVDPWRIVTDSFTLAAPMSASTTNT